MKKPVLTPFGYASNNYLLLLNPPGNLETDIMADKKRFVFNYPKCITLSRPHITLATFSLYEESESRIIKRLEQVSMSTAPIEVELKDYGRFQKPNTIFINIVSRTPIQNLVKDIRVQMRGHIKVGNSPHFIMEPHITIARQIEESQFAKAWREYSHGLFSGSFIAGGMTLLKRAKDERVYTNVCHLHFENLPSPVKQAYLFG